MLTPYFNSVHFPRLRDFRTLCPEHENPCSSSNVEFWFHGIIAERRARLHCVAHLFISNTCTMITRMHW